MSLLALPGCFLGGLDDVVTLGLPKHGSAVLARDTVEVHARWQECHHSKPMIGSGTVACEDRPIELSASCSRDGCQANEVASPSGEGGRSVLLTLPEAEGPVVITANLRRTDNGATDFQQSTVEVVAAQSVGPQCSFGRVRQGSCADAWSVFVATENRTQAMPFQVAVAASTRDGVLHPSFEAKFTPFGEAGRSTRVPCTPVGVRCATIDAAGTLELTGSAFAPMRLELKPDGTVVLR